MSEKFIFEVQLRSWEQNRLVLEKQNLNTKDYWQISKTKTPEEALHELPRVLSSNFIGIYVCLCLSFKLPVAVIKFYTSNYRFVLISTRSKFFHGHKDYCAIQKWIFENSSRNVCYRIFWPFIFDRTSNIKLPYIFITWLSWSFILPKHDSLHVI